MVTLGFLCLFIAFVIGIMFLMALAARDRTDEREKVDDNPESNEER
jgi:hypothetical protein